MPSVNKSALVPYSASQMYDLVDKISDYPNFLPWCGGAEEISRSDDEVEASVTISHSGLNKSFTTRNRLQKNKMIEMELVNGPFKHLHGFWKFEALSDTACKVSLDLEYEFSNKLLSLAIGPVFSQVANTMVDSFCQQANRVYSDK
jgi:ribosome-associated toxin RatA of RatAB toxin-antitoxin module